jgi:hypothetical protein
MGPTGYRYSLTLLTLTFVLLKLIVASGGRVVRSNDHDQLAVGSVLDSTGCRSSHPHGPIVSRCRFLLDSDEGG